MNYDFKNNIYELDALENIATTNELSKDEWCEISSYQKLSEDFIEKYKDKVDWCHISYRQKLSENFIAKYKDKVDWNGISSMQVLSESFIDEYENNVCWYNISYKQKLSEEFIDKYKGSVEWANIVMYQKLSYEFLEKHLYMYSLYIPNFNLSDNILKLQKNIRLNTRLIDCLMKLSEWISCKYSLHLY